MVVEDLFRRASIASKIDNAIEKIVKSIAAWKKTRWRNVSAASDRDAKTNDENASSAESDMTGQTGTPLPVPGRIRQTPVRRITAPNRTNGRKGATTKS